ncbi:hypothetical protein EWM64_g5699 [Hericium alpestre]|uniref:SET domain-containing protein n=1 Tax=Hericium alpestre TaxID=135208 RepID=A0A4Y9ZTS9_9AGAM|nr:hypothetical protein EWM64_g5699 [Hericium alpestre]
MCTKRPLVAGDVIYAERPFIALPVKFYLTSAPPSGLTLEGFTQHAWKEREELLKEMIALLPPERQAAYRALANSHTHDGSGPLAGVFRTNGFGLGLDTWREIIPDIDDRDNRADHETTISGVCDTLSRINHSCCPNADVYFDMPSFSFVLSAVRDIPAGTDVTVGYCDLTDPAAARQKDLTPYGFTCTCVACVSPNSSDPRRATIAASFPDPKFVVRMWLMNVVLPDDYVIQDSQRMIRLIEEEGLQSAWCYTLHFAVLAMAYAALGQRENYLQARERVSALGRACNPVEGHQLMVSLPEFRNSRSSGGCGCPTMDGGGLPSSMRK